MNNVYLLIGGNMGDRLAMLKSATDLIQKYCGNIRLTSSIYETAAWGPIQQAPFLNQVIVINTLMLPEKLMQQLLDIEQQLGRTRTISMGPRSIDIDILYFNNEIFSTPDLTIPHPRIQDRRFVLVPLTEIAPEMQHPILQLTHTELLIQCTDNLPVQKKQAL